jgi:hypothetical protein
MHQTTVRFGPDLWEALEAECARLGMSAAQYLREAALARLSYMAGQRGDKDYERALEDAGVALVHATSPADEGSAERRATAAISEQRRLATAVSAQGKRARSRARELRAQTDELRVVRLGLESDSDFTDSGLAASSGGAGRPSGR